MYRSQETKQIKVTKTVVYDVDSIKWKIQWGKPAGYIVSFDEVVEHLHRLYDRRCKTNK